MAHSVRSLVVLLALSWFACAEAGVWEHLGPEGGIMPTVVGHPTDPNVAFASSEFTSVYKTTDAGVSWSEVPLPVSFEPRAGIAFDPSAPSTVYVTGQLDVYKSTDAGATWTRHPTPPGNPGPVRAVAVDPTNGLRVYAGATAKVLVSADGGLTWSSTSLPDPGAGDVYALAVDASGTVFAGAEGLWRSTDGGASFVATTVGGFVQAIAIDPTGAAVLAASSL